VARAEADGVAMRFFRVCALVAVLTTACAAVPPQGQAFVDDMLGRLRKAMPGSELTVEPNEPLVIRVKGGDWDTAVINLHRIENYCKTASAPDCEATKQDFVASVSKKPEKASRGGLRVIVRDKQYVDYVRNLPDEGAQKGKRAMIYQPIGEDLYAVLAFETTKSIGLVGDAGLEDIGMTGDAAWALGMEQTRKRIPSLPTVKQLSKSAVAYQDQDFLSSMLIDLAGWKSLSDAVGPDLFMTVVSDRFVFVGKMPDGPDLEKFRKTVAEDCEHQERCVSPNLYRFRGGRWVVAR
jgi:hypothetical protein